MTFDDWLGQHSADRAAAGLERRLRPRAPTSSVIDLAGNDYLGLRTDRRVTAAAAAAATTWGAGAGASRLVTGALHLHTELESALARFTGRESALVFSSGYQANLGVVTGLADPDTLIVSDAHVHASLVDACRLARPARLVIVPHNDTVAVAEALRGRQEPRALVLVESVYSVLGDAAPLPALATACGTYGAVLVVDEAHALGVCGPGGRGLVEAHGLSSRRDVVSTLTLSKSLGSQGGAVLGSPAVIRHLVNTARTFIYDTGLAPAATGAALEALRIVVAEPERPRRVLELAHSMASSLRLVSPAGPVLSVPMASAAEALRAQAELGDEGFDVGCFRPPSVPDGVSRLRLTARASLSPPEVARVLQRLAGLAGLAVEAGAATFPPSPGDIRALSKGPSRPLEGTFPPSRRDLRALSREGGGPTRVVVVTGTDTGVGKTVTTAALARIALDRGLTVAVVKPTQTGAASGEPTDVATIATLSGCAHLTELVRLDDPLAPDTAARRQGVTLPPVEELAERTLAAAEGCDLILVEGAGGVSVRLDTNGGTLLGLATALQRGAHVVGFVVVTRLSLGTLNHTTLTVEAVRSAGQEVSGLVVGAVPDVLGVAERCNLTELPRVTALPLLGAIPAGAGHLDSGRFRAACARWLPDTDWLTQP